MPTLNAARRMPAPKRLSRLRLEVLEDRVVPTTSGTLDNTFGFLGESLANFGQPTGASHLNAMVLQPDGKVVAVGDTPSGFGPTFAVARFNPDGSLDGSFAGGQLTQGFYFPGLFGSPPVNPGPYLLNTSATGVALEPNGEIVAVGNAHYPATPNVNTIVLTKLFGNGATDQNFNLFGGPITINCNPAANPVRLPAYPFYPAFGGEVAIMVNGNCQANAVAVQPDGKILVAGSAVNVNGSLSGVLLVRLNPDGTLDPSFGAGGVVETSLGNTDAAAQGIALQADGHIVVVGHSSTVAGNFHFAVLRYNPDGSLDHSLNGTGIVLDNFAGSQGHDNANGVAIQSDGKIVVTGSFLDANQRQDVALARYNPNGALDVTFNGTGHVSMNIPNTDDAGNAVAVQSNDKILVAGVDVGNPSGGFMLLRYNPDGSVDTSFGVQGDGCVVTAVSFSGDDSAAAVALQPDNGILAAGTTQIHFNSAFAVARYVGDPVDAALSGQPVAVSAVDNTPFSGAVATFTDADPTGGQVTDFTATVNWGDGTQTAGTVSVNSGGGYAVNGTHTYSVMGAYVITANVHDQGGANLTVTSTMSVTDFAVAANANNLTAQAGAGLAAPVVVFTDPDPNGTAAQFTATVNWGDGTRSAGTVSASPGGGFAVNGGHAYVAPGVYTVKVNIRDQGGASSQVAGTVTVKPTAPTNTLSIQAVGSGGATVVYAVTPGQGLARYDAAHGWLQIGGAGSVSSISAVADASGNAVVFVVTADHALARFDLATGWQMLGAPGTVLTASAGTDAAGRADVFVLLPDTSLTEWSGSAGWAPLPIGGAGTIAAFTALRNNAVVVITANHAVYEHNDLYGWFALTSGGFAKSISAVTDAFGHEVVYAQAADQSLWRHDASGWVRIGGAGSVQALTAGSDASGRDNVFVVTAGGALAEFDSASGWSLPKAPGAVAEFSAAGSDRVFTVLSDGSVFEHDDVLGWARLAGAGFAHT